jgi:PAS domain S-box-containing protein
LLLTLALFSLAVGLLGVYIFGRQRDHIRSSAREELAAIADLKVEGIRRWRQERLADGQWIVEASNYAAEARDFLSQPDNPNRRANAQIWMDGWYRISAYRRVLLLDPTLNVRLAVPAGAIALDPTSLAAAQTALKRRAVEVVDLHLEASNGRAALDLVAPLVLRDGGNDLVGLLLLEIDPQQFLFPHLQTWPTPSRTGETLLVRREGDTVVYLNELRHRPETALRLSISLSQRQLPAVRAVLGETGVVEGQDYRGASVLAALRAVPDSPWFIVAKRDLAEIDAPARQWAWLLGLGTLALIGAAAAGVGMVWRAREAKFARDELIERSRSEEALRAREAQLQSVYSAMTEMLAVHEIVADAAGRAIDYRIVDCNPAFERITGIPRDRAVGALATALYGATPAPFLDTYARVAATGEPAQFEVFFPPMGKHFAISAFSPRRGSFATVTNDITEEREAAEALHDSRQRLAAIVESSDDGIVGMDLNAVITSWNRGAEMIFGYPAAEMVGTSIMRLIPADRQDEEKGILGKIIRGERVEHFVTLRQRKDGQLINVSVTASPIRNAAGKIIGASKASRDITKHMQMEAERLQLLHELERKNQELEGMIYVASHDLRAPLVNVQGFGQRLEKACAELVAQGAAKSAAPAADGPSPTDQIAKALHYIRTSTDKMEGLISGLLRVSRAGRITVNFQTVDMGRLLQKVAAAIEFQIQQAKAEVRVDLLPPCRGDEELLGQVFSNLLDNALKYRAPDRPLRIGVSGRTDGPEVIYQVTDTGLGIAAEHQGKIWEMFHRLHPDGPVAGEGLGLKIARRILDRHGGRIWVESTPGAGSRFFVALPGAPDGVRPKAS